MTYFAVLLVGSQCPSALHAFVSQSSQSWLNRLGCAPGQNYPPLDTEAMLEDGEVVKLVHRVAVALSSAEAGEFCDKAGTLRQCTVPSFQYVEGELRISAPEVA